MNLGDCMAQHGTIHIKGIQEKPAHLQIKCTFCSSLGEL